MDKITQNTLQIAYQHRQWLSKESILHLEELLKIVEKGIGEFEGMMKFYNRLIKNKERTVELILKKKALNRFLTSMDEFENKPKGYHHMLMGDKIVCTFVLKNFPNKEVLVKKYSLERNYPLAYKDSFKK